MQFSKYIALAIAMAMPALAAPVNNERTVGTAEIDGRSYLLVTDVDPTEKRSYLLVTDVPVNEKRGEAGEYLKNEAGVVFKLVPVDK